jgi:hypothetical protein
MNDLLIKFGLRFENAEQEASFVRSFALGELRRAQAAMVLGAIVYCPSYGPRHSPSAPR